MQKWEIFKNGIKIDEFYNFEETALSGFDDWLEENNLPIDRVDNDFGVNWCAEIYGDFYECNNSNSKYFE